MIISKDVKSSKISNLDVNELYDLSSDVDETKNCEIYPDIDYQDSKKWSCVNIIVDKIICRKDRNRMK